MSGDESIFPHNKLSPGGGASLPQCKERMSGRAGCAHGDGVTVPARLRGSSWPVSLDPPSLFPSCLPALGGHLWVATSKWPKSWEVTFPWGMELLIFFFFFKIFFFLNVDPVLKSLLNLLQYCFCFMFWFFDLLACGVLAPPPGIKPAPPAVEGEVLIPRLPGKYQASVL